jgi:DnaJ family protein B protein 4
MDDYYNILGVSKDATDTDIKKAYKKLAVKWHPDKNPDNKKEAEQHFKKISEAYQVLSNKEKRKEYDLYGKEGIKNDYRNFNYGNISPEELFRQFFHTNNIFDLYNDPYHNNRSRHYNKGDTITNNLHCTLEELYHGKKRKFKISRKIYNTDGSYTIDTMIKVINIGRGWKDGTKITFERVGDIYPNTEAGDMVFIIKELKHNIYVRDDNNLILQCHISLKEALKGFERQLTLMNGTNKQIKMKPMKRSNETYIINNGGMPIRNNNKVIGYGDLIIKFIINLN